MTIDPSSILDLPPSFGSLSLPDSRPSFGDTMASTATNLTSDALYLGGFGAMAYGGYKAYQWATQSDTAKDPKKEATPPVKPKNSGKRVMGKGIKLKKKIKIKGLSV